MHYIVFDLEFNQSDHLAKDDKTDSELKCPFEVIQIGAVKLNQNLQKVDAFNKLVKPQIYKELNKYVKEVTGLVLKDFNGCDDFTSVYSEFLDFIKCDSCILCVWGTVDLRELIRNIKYYNLNTALLPKDYIDIQRHVSKYLGCPKGTSIGLGKAVELLKIHLKHELHDAYNDAYYTAEVFKKTFDKSIKPKKYETYRRKSSSTLKYRVDTEKMFVQFEKMLNRKITGDEKSIIKLAYMMGKTNQFLIESPKKSCKNSP